MSIDHDHGKLENALIYQSYFLWIILGLNVFPQNKLFLLVDWNSHYCGSFLLRQIIMEIAAVLKFYKMRTQTVWCSFCCINLIIKKIYATDKQQLILNFKPQMKWEDDDLYFEFKSPQGKGEIRNSRAGGKAWQEFTVLTGMEVAFNKNLKPGNVTG